MRKIALGSLAVTLMLAAGCGSAPAGAGPARNTAGARPAAAGTSHATASSATASATAGATTAGQTCARGEIGPMSASFISASGGWLLGATLPDCWVSGASRLVVRKTNDGGRHWSAVPAPPAPVPWTSGSGGPPAASVSEIYFADARDGWAFGPGLWSTHDGGATWHRVATGGRSVYSLTATDGHVVAAFLSCGTGCGRGAASSFTIETTPARSDSWRPVPGAAGLGQPQVTAAGGTAYALGARSSNSDMAPALLLTGPADGTARWHAHATPCHAIGSNMTTAVTGRDLVMACAMLGAHPTPNHLYRSDDSGAHWRQFSVVGLYDGTTSLSVAPDGTLLLAGIYNGVGLSSDGGRSWHWPATVDHAQAVGGGDLIDAAMTSNDDGFVIVGWGLLWITRDAGRTWTQVIVR
jgi:hypothetical protein